MNPGPLHPGRRALSLALGALALLGACTRSQAPAGGASGGAAAPLSVTVIEVQPLNIPATIEVVAETEGARETEVRARVGGIITRRLYQEGDAVKAGQPLFQIDRAPYEIALSEARARAEQTAREAKRLQPLVEARAVARKDYDDALSNNAMAQAALRQAELNLSWTTVTAPVAGTTGRALKSDGNLVTAGSDALLTSIYQTDPIWVRFSLGESDLARFPAGRLTAADVQGIALVQGNGEVYEQPGRLNFVATNIDTTLGTQQLRAEFANREGRLLPGQFVRVRLLIGEHANAFLVPQSAVVQTDRGTLLMTVGPENKVAPRPVRTGEWQGKDWVILDGLQAGDQVIVDNLIKLRPGMPVAPHAPAAAGAPAPTPAQKG